MGARRPAAFFDAIAAAVDDCAEMEIERLTDASAPEPDAAPDSDDLSAEQEAALRAAIEHGYHGTPREVDVGELADRLDVPRSTLTYRLRRAEAHLAKQYTADNPSPTGVTTSFRPLAPFWSIPRNG